MYFTSVYIFTSFRHLSKEANVTSIASRSNWKLKLLMTKYHEMFLKFQLFGNLLHLLFPFNSFSKFFIATVPLFLKSLEDIEIFQSVEREKRLITTQKVPQKNIWPGLLTELVRSRWLNIGQVLFLHVYRTRWRQVHKQKRIRPISSLLDQTSLVNKWFITAHGLQSRLAKVLDIKRCADEKCSKRKSSSFFLSFFLSAHKHTRTLFLLYRQHNPLSNSDINTWTIWSSGVWINCFTSVSLLGLLYVLDTSSGTVSK